MIEHTPVALAVDPVEVVACQALRQAEVAPAPAEGVEEGPS